MKINKKIIFLLIVFLGSVQAYAGYFSKSGYEGPEKEARFSGKTSDAGIDLDGDGLYEKLRVTAEIDVVLPGEYTVAGAFRISEDSWGNGAETRKPFTTGKHTVEIDFDSQIIRLLRTDGPYEVKLSLPECIKGDVIHLEDRTVQFYITGKYSWKQFKGSGTEFTGIYSDRTKDTDGDGKIDAILIDIEVLAASSGEYEIEGWLSTPCYNPCVAVKTKLPEGRSKVTLEYETRDYFSCRYTGRYGLHALQISQNGVMKDGIGDTGPLTRSYSYKDFWTPPIYFDPQGFREVTKDNWVGGLIQYLEVHYELQPEVKSVLPYTIFANLYDADGAIVAESRLDAVARPNEMSGVIIFSGKEIRKSGKNGPYRVGDIILLSGGEGLIDQFPEDIITKPYRYDDFGPKE